MAGLFMGFKIVKEEDKKKKPPPLPPRDDISEDSMENMVSDLEADGGSPPKQKTGAHTKNNLSIDTDYILQNANQMINTSLTSEGFESRGKNAQPLP